MSLLYAKRSKLILFLLVLFITSTIIPHLFAVDAAITNQINFQSKIVEKTTGLNITNGSPACVKSGADTCDFQVRIWNHPTNTSTTSGSGNLMYTITFQDVEIGDSSGIFNLTINDCGSGLSSQPSGTSQWGTTTGNCTVVDDSDGDSDPGVNFNRNDLWLEVGFAPTDTTGSLGSFTELFTRTQFKSVPSAYSAQTLDGVTKDGFVQLTPGSTQIATSTDSLINLETTANTSNTLVLVNENGAGTPNLFDYQVAGSSRLSLTNVGQLVLPVTGSTGGLVIGGDTNLYRDSANVLRTGDSLVADINISAGTTTSTAFLNAAASTTGKASLRLVSSAGTNPSAPNSGDLWWNGTNLYFYDGASNKDVLAGSCLSCVNFSTGSTQTSTDSDSLIDITTTGNVPTTLVIVNENGSGTPSLLSLQVAGNPIFEVSNSGQLGIGTNYNASYGIHQIKNFANGGGAISGHRSEVSGNSVATTNLYGQEYFTSLDGNSFANNVVYGISNTTSINDSGSNGSLYGIYNTSVISNNSAYNVGIENVLNFISGSSSSLVHGLNIATNLNGTAVVTDLNSINIRGSAAGNVTNYKAINISNTNSATNSYGLYLDSLSGTSNNYGIYIATQSTASNDYGLYIAGADTYAIWSDSGINRFDEQVQLGAATTGASSLRITNSSGVNPSSPTSGDLWWNGTNLYFYNGTSNVDLLAGGGSCVTCVNFSTGSTQTSTDSDGLIDMTTTGNVSNSLIRVTESGAGTPDFLRFVRGSTPVFIVENTGYTGINDGLSISGTHTLTGASTKYLLHVNANNSIATGDGNAYTGLKLRTSFDGGGFSGNNIVGIDSYTQSAGNNVAAQLVGFQNNLETKSSDINIAVRGIMNSISIYNTVSQPILGVASILGTQGAGTVSKWYGFYTQIGEGGVDDTITDSYGYFVRGDSGGLGPINGYGLYVESMQGSALNYGIYIENQTSATNDYGLYIAGAGTYAIWSASGDNRFGGNILAGTATSTAFLNVGAATTSKASIRLMSSSGTNPSSPNSGDLWWNGTNLYFYNGSTNVDILAGGGSCVTCVNFSTGSTQTSTDTDALIDVTTTGNVTNALLRVNENGAGTPNLIDLLVGGTSRLLFSNAGQLQLSVTGNTGGLLIGADTNLYRGAANQLNTDDSFALADNLYVGSTTETLANAGFVIDGDDAFVAGMMGVEGNIYTDGSFITGSTLTLSDGSITQSTTGTGNLTISTTGGSAGLLALTASTRINFTASTAIANTTNSAFNFQATNNLGASDELFQIGDSGSGTLLTLYGNGNLSVGGTTTGTASLNVAAATTGQASLRLISSAGTNPSAPNSGDLWWNGTNLYFYNGTVNVDLLAGGGSCVTCVSFSTGSTQTSTDTDALIDVTTTGTVTNALLRVNENGAGTPNLIDLLVGGTSRLLLSNAGQLQLAVAGNTGGLLIGGDVTLYRDSADVLRTGDSLLSDINISAGTTTSTAFINAAAATTGKSSLRLISSAGTDVAAPNSGDMWWNGTNLYFNNGVSNRDLLAGLNITTKNIQTSTILCTVTLGANGYFDTDNDCGGLSNTYTHLEINYKTRASSAASADLSHILFNNDTTFTNYGANVNYTTAGTVSAFTAQEPIITYSSDTSLPANSYSTGKITILNYRDSKNKVARSEFGYLFSASQTIIGYAGVVWENNAAITRVTFRPDSYPTDTFLAGSTFELVGIKEETVVTNVTSGGSGTAPFAVNTGSTLTGLDILYTSTGTTADAIKIANNTTGVITDALDVSDAEIVNAINLGDNNIVQTDGGTVNWNDSAGNNLIQITDIATNHGASVEAGSIVSRNSYFGDEFSRERADVTADTTQSWGDDLAWTVDELLPTTNDCTWSIVDDAVNGISRMAISSLLTNTACSMYNGRAVGTAHLTQLAANLPLVIMKLRPSNVGANDQLRTGLMNSTTPDGNDPSNGIYFSNNAGTTWTGVTRSGGTSTNVVCTGQTISTTQFALLKIEVRSTTDVRFYVDTDVSNGVSWFYCGSSATNVPSAGLTQSIRLYSTSNSRSVDVDYFRNWSDDTVLSAPVSTPEEPVQTEEETNPQTPIENEEENTLPPLSYTVEEQLEQISQNLQENTEMLNSLSFITENITYDEATDNLSISSSVVSLNNLVISGSAEVYGTLKITGDLEVQGNIRFANNNIGTIVFEAGELEKEITFTQPKASVPIVFISVQNSNVQYVLSNITENGFKVTLMNPPESQITLNWLSVNSI